MTLTDERIKEVYASETGFILDDEPAALLDFARAIAAEQRKIDAEICTEESDSGIAKRCAKAILKEGEE